MNNNLWIHLLLSVILGPSLLAPVYGMHMQMTKPQEIQIDIQAGEYISPRVNNHAKGPHSMKFIDLEAQNRHLRNDKCAKAFIGVMTVAFLVGMGYGMHAVGMLDS